MIRKILFGMVFTAVVLFLWGFLVTHYQNVAVGVLALTAGFVLLVVPPWIYWRGENSDKLSPKWWWKFICFFLFFHPFVLFMKFAIRGRRAEPGLLPPVPDDFEKKETYNVGGRPILRGFYKFSHRGLMGRIR